MKQFFSVLSFLLLLSVAADAQLPMESLDTASNNKAPQLVFIFEEDQLYYNSLKEKGKTKVDTIEKVQINKILDSELSFLKVNKNKLSVVIDGDTVMSDPYFEILLDTLLDRKLKQVRILTSL